MDTKVLNMFPTTVNAQYVRIIPTQVHIRGCMRIEVLGCEEQEDTISLIESKNESFKITSEAIDEEFFFQLSNLEDNILRKLGSSSSRSIFHEDQSIYYRAILIENTYNGKHVLVETSFSSSAKINVPQSEENLTVVIIYNGHESLATQTDVPFEDMKALTYVISGIFSITIFTGNVSIKGGSVEMKLPLQHEKSNRSENNIVCGFFDNVIRKWSTRGCLTQNLTNDTVHCFCNHLTSFTILLKISSIEEDSKSMEPVFSKLSHIGVVFSIVFLAITLTIVWGLRDLRQSERYRILRHLIIALLISNIFFLALDADLRDAPLICGFIAGCLHYSFLAAFTWMIVLSTDLFIKIKNPFADHKKRFQFCRVGAWIFPLPIIVFAAAITREHYISTNKCWLNINSGAIWTFIVPVCLTVLIVGIQLSFIGYVAFQKSHTPGQSEDQVEILKRMRIMLWRILLLTPAVGFLWIFGVLVIFDDSDVIEYVYITLNSMQGVLIWISQCVFSKEVRQALRKTFSNKVELQRDTQVTA